MARQKLGTRSAEWLRLGTSVAALFPRALPSGLAPRFVRLSVEGAVAAAVSLLLAGAADAAQAAVVAVFFTAAGLAHRFDGLLEENRELVWGGDSRGANVRTAVSLLAMFLGAFTVFAAAVVLAPQARMEKTLAVIVQATNIGQDTILTRRFGSFWGLLSYNAGVLATVCTVSALYRSLGALLALSWNAGLWAVVLTSLMRRAMTVTAMSKGVFLVLAWVAVLPHLLLEAAAYVTASLGAIFVSRGLMLYTLSDARLRRVAGAAARMWLAAMLLLTAAALAESTLPRLLLSHLGG